MQLIIINGPNLNLLGKREPEIYGKTSFEEYFQNLKKEYPDIRLSYFQSNHEGELIDKIQETGYRYDGIIINPAALTHYSLALADAIAAVTTKVVEVHISNIYAREEFRKKSVTASNCAGVITGLGLYGYKAAIGFFLNADQ